MKMKMDVPLCSGHLYPCEQLPAFLEHCVKLCRLLVKEECKRLEEHTGVK